MLKARAVTKSFETGGRRITVLDGIDFDLAAGESAALTGESGSGKSTFLHLIAGLDGFDGGEISVNGKDLSRMDDTMRSRLRRETLGVVFQQFNLIPSLSVADNLGFQARIAGHYDEDWGRDLLIRLGLAEMADRFPEQLSGGQQQRVAIGRALATRPALLLADEPTGNLDEATGDTVMDLLLGLVAETGTSVLMVTHSQRLAAKLDRVVTLKGGKIL